MRTRNRFTSVVALAAAALMLLPSMALADDIVHDVDASVGSMALTAGGGDGTTVLSVITRNGDGKNGCNLTGSTVFTASVSSSNESVATVSPSSVTFSSCEDTPTLTVTPVAEGSSTISLEQVANSTAGSFNLAPAQFTVNVAAAQARDTSPPVITPNVSGTVGNNDWYTSDVTVSWTVEDEESAITTVGCDTVNITADQLDEQYTCEATSAGGSSSRSVTIKRDATAPTNVQFSGGPADGGVYFPTTVPADGTCTADADISGLASCGITGRSTTVGSHTLTATAADNAGNVATATRTYRVRLLTLDGYFKPVDMTANVANTVKGGATVPLKFIAADEGTPVISTAGMSFRATQVNCQTGLVEDAMTTDETTTGGTQLRYDAEAAQFIQNWQTPKKPGTCWKAAMTFIDGQNITALFKLK